MSLLRSLLRRVAWALYMLYFYEPPGAAKLELLILRLAVYMITVYFMALAAAALYSGGVQLYTR